MKTILLALTVAVALVAAPAVARAGGGSKSSGTVKVQNQSGSTVMVILANQNNSLTNLNNLLTNGGTGTGGTVTEANVRQAAAADNARVITVANGNTGTFTGLQAGTYQVIAADVDAGSVGGGFASQLGTVKVNKGQTATITIPPQTT